MPDYIIPRLFSLKDVPEFQRFSENNPQNIIDAMQTAIMYGRAAHWMFIIEVLWPPFDKIDSDEHNVSFTVQKDPDNDPFLDDAYYEQIRTILKTFWTIQLTDLFPEGDWEIKPGASEILIQTIIHQRIKLD